jgi:hypothetical protein
MRVGSTMRLRYSNHGRDMPVPGADIARMIEGRLCTCWNSRRSIAGS